MLHAEEIHGNVLYKIEAASSGDPELEGIHA